MDYSQPFNWPVLLWLIALVVFVALFFRAYRKSTKPPQDVKKKNKNKKRLIRPERPQLSLLGQPGRMIKKDWFLILALTVIYGALAFSFSGSTTAPQTFWRTGPGDIQGQPALTLDLGEEVQLDNIIYYTGLGDCAWNLELSADGQNWRMQSSMVQYFYMDFRWNIPLMEEGYTDRTRFIRITNTSLTDGAELGELGLVILDENDSRSLLDVTSLPTRHPQYAALFDEQSLIPNLPDLDNNSMYNRLFSIETSQGTISDNTNGMIFDEFYFARTAYDFIHNLSPREITHPPLGKEIIAIGINLFGMTPFGWRFMGILFGVLMVPLLYVFIKNLFDNTTVAACGAALFAFENMHFTQTHLATIDTYVVFFIIAMYLFMYRYISSGYDKPFVKTLPALLLCGLSFGLGAATKWTAFYAALGLVALYITYLVKRGRYQTAAGQKKEYHVFLWQTLAASVGIFIVIPFIIYVLSYIPYTTANGQPLTVGGLLGDMWNNQAHMLNYHGSTMAGATHQFQSRWWEWVLDLRPILYYSRFQEGTRTFIGAFTNPLVTIGGLAAVCIALYDCFRKRIKEALVIVVGYLAQLVPWILVPRTAFAYHYFPSVIFLTLALCYIFNNMLKRRPEYKRWVYAFTGVSVGLFFLLLPPTVGLTMADWYSAWFVKWLPGWPF